MLSKLFIKTPFWAKLIFNRLTWHIESDEKTLYLTFDDGPIPGVTELVLDTLKVYNAKATFFCIGENIEKHPKIFKRILSEGHQIGNHTQNHLNAREVDTDTYMENFISCEQTIKKHLPSTQVDLPKLFRPPYGRTTFKTRNRILNRGYKMIMWDVLSADYMEELPPEACLNNVLHNTSNGSIIVFHDSLKAKKNLIYTLMGTLAHFTKKGYVFKSINPT
ncbi:Peptidoglycan/xylan/chitin deacetylase, PgdA/CDA1 family [Zhouia amylolytica]|uniref:Peptidoglycan/xylan/chitin deacetylase, PgdA/CDA1 family n=1 Tax=Zhouia amylolytica TaxID=376730 RepID=A0A1I6VDU7_9FLAO|nr:polysaccharide deacetylase family protein [Zhouia amylolytica]MCQ0110366.1 polysaccharide deacetylase family protein [Zhouia amylolytica]SFT11832.1 Peptidoglycan/xylan/chitin deacetylase, PgdA/CDA1 family [Zhouia amylolytica]